jgi:NAD(P)-dependent dehydrogenase (short-subunit alcohol dehydrogenase family)
MKNPQGSVAVITGANRELGAGMAKRFEQPDEVGIVRPLNPGTDLTGYCVGVASDRAGRRAIRRRSAAESVAVATVLHEEQAGRPRASERLDSTRTAGTLCTEASSLKYLPRQISVTEASD